MVTLSLLFCGLFQDAAGSVCDKRARPSTQRTHVGEDPHDLSVSEHAEESLQAPTAALFGSRHQSNYEGQ